MPSQHSSSGSWIASALALLATAALCLAQEASPIEVTATADKQRITIGDILHYRVEAICPPGTKVRIPDAAERLAPFEVRDYSSKQEAHEGKLRVIFTYQLVIFEVGEREVAGVKLEYLLPKAEKPRTIEAPAVKITVASVLPANAQDIKDIREPVPVKMGAEQWLAAALVALAVLLVLAVIAYFLTRRLRRRRAVVEPEVIIAAHERALRELEALADSELLLSADFKGFYTRLSEITREYLEARFGVRAMEETTWMIDRDLEREGVQRQWREEFAALLRRADLVKFARHELDAPEAETDLDAARRVVEASRPIAPVESQEAEPLPAASS